jgi:predicted N-acetyltransferase YhbS
VTSRAYSFERDFGRVADFLVEHYRDRNADGNWLQPTWEYAQHHTLLDGEHQSLWRTWEEGGQIIGVAHYEWFLGEAFFQVAPGRNDLKPIMLDYVEQEMRGERDGRQFVRAWCIDSDRAFADELARRGYRRVPGEDRPLCIIDLNGPLEYTVPEGFRLQSLAEDNDLAKINRCLWRGFNHEGEADDSVLEGRKRTQSGPHFRHDLTMTVVAPNGEYVAFAGSWIEPRRRYAQVEPVATDPDYRRMGLGRAAVLEGMRRCAAEGARVGYVGSNQDFYHAIGFSIVNNEECWERIF